MPGPRQGRSAASARVLAALQAALSAEEAASYGYGVVGAHLAGQGPLFAEATRCWVAHQRARDELEQLMLAAGGRPAAAAVAYQLPIAPRAAAGARALAVRLEAEVISAYLGMVGLDHLALREFGARQMQESAMRSARWDGRSVAFPGLPASAVSGAGHGRQAPAR